MNTIDRIISKDFLQTKHFRKVLFRLGVFIIALLIFQAGMLVGFRKAEFSFRMGDNYYRAFDGDEVNGYKLPFGMSHLRGGAFPGSHGAIGQVIKIDLPTLIIEDPKNVEKEVLVSTSTLIKKFRHIIKKEDIKADDFVTVIGSPNDKSQIEAKFIRVIPAPNGYHSTTASSTENTTN